MCEHRTFVYRRKEHVGKSGEIGRDCIPLLDLTCSKKTLNCFNLLSTCNNLADTNMNIIPAYKRTDVCTTYEGAKMVFIMIRHNSAALGLRDSIVAKVDWCCFAVAEFEYDKKIHTDHILCVR
ncbi:hypothetical protein HELRODRAFT_175030 [Helobdella robusta]|uniref:Uncharacterized protein n=1 Tax=Helobdella robusta TaxID=6412 RepID=T1F8R1_HELRO|nr:hypothetical protein HELRODRAFT_175030 [Helobdella robusta]ESO01006.1 hypothetical protein HELRODRAFT_175030 [Helobdella robusta]